MRSGAAIEIHGLTKTLGTPTAPIEILRGLNFQAASGEFVAVTGASGSGKSTLLHLVAGLDSPN
jgi:ABC-type lipoprotein export system ATPase subunit